jgi:hypothetical protein
MIHWFIFFENFQKQFLTKTRLFCIRFVSVCVQVKIISPAGFGRDIKIRELNEAIEFKKRIYFVHNCLFRFFAFLTIFA